MGVYCSALRLVRNGPGDDSRPTQETDGATAASIGVRAWRQRVRRLTGLIVLTLGLALAAAFLDTIALLGDLNELARGFCNGLAVAAFVVAIVLMVRSRRPA